MIHKEMPIPTNEAFLKDLLHKFNKMEDLSVDFQTNKPMISDLIVGTLKNLHVFWNVHR